MNEDSVLQEVRAAREAYARSHGYDVRAMVADAVQRGHCSVPDLCTELNAGPSVGSALFRQALTDVADGIRSAAEGDLKDLLTKSRLPMPLFNASLYIDDTFIARPDV